MTTEDIVAFKYELRNRNYYRAQIVKKEEEASDLWYLLSGVKAVRTDQVRITPNSHDIAEHRNRLTSMISKLENDIKFLEQKLRYIDSVLNQIPEETRTMMIDIYCDGATYDDEAIKTHWSRSAIQYHINKVLKAI